MPETGDISQIPRYDGPNATRTVTRELGKDEFLKLFVTRLQHQDPLSPMEDEAFIAQLAQFSSLEQLTNINDTLSSGLGLAEELAPLQTLESIKELLGENQQYNVLLSQTINNTMAAGLIDRMVTWESDAVALKESGDVNVYYRLDAPARAVVAKMFDSQGQLVRVLSAGELSAGEHTFVWDGQDTAGNRLPKGNYRIEISAMDAAGDSSSPPARFRGRVDGVQYIDGQAYLDVGGVLVSLADVRELRSTQE